MNLLLRKVHAHRLSEHGDMLWRAIHAAACLSGVRVLWGCCPACQLFGLSLLNTPKCMLVLQVEKWHDAMRVALALNSRPHIERVFTTCTDTTDKEQLAYLLARQGVLLDVEAGPCAMEDETARETVHFQCSMTLGSVACSSNRCMSAAADRARLLSCAALPGLYCCCCISQPCVDSDTGFDPFIGSSSDACIAGD